MIYRGTILRPTPAVISKYPAWPVPDPGDDLNRLNDLIRFFSAVMEDDRAPSPVRREARDDLALAKMFRLDRLHEEEQQR